MTYSRSSRSEVFCKQYFLKNFAKFTGKHLQNTHTQVSRSAHLYTALRNEVVNYNRDEWLEMAKVMGLANFEGQ